MNILIVEDERRLADALGKLLSNAGYFSDAVGDGVSALEYLDSAEYDLVILDVMLPRLDGFGVVQAMRERKNNTPVLMLTARTTVPDKISGLNAGADDYMTKPFDTGELLARVRALTRRTGEVILNKLTFSDLTLELDSARLCCGSSSVQLSRKELDVAKLLLANPSATTTKETIIIKVWGGDSDVTENNVEAYVSFLRKKLRFLKSRVTIKNIQRIGYRLEESEC